MQEGLGEGIPGGAGRCRGTACLRGGPQRPGCSWKRGWWWDTALLVCPSPPRFSFATEPHAGGTVHPERVPGHLASPDTPHTTTGATDPEGEGILAARGCPWGACTCRCDRARGSQAGLTRRWPPARRSRRRPSGRTCTGRVRHWDESWCSVWWQALQRVGRTT